MVRKEIMMGRRAGWAALAALVVLTAGERQARADAAYAWGYNGSGQVGNGTSASSGVSTPTAVSGLSGGIRSVGSGYDFSLAVTSSGQVYAWGDGQYGTLGNGTSGSGDHSDTPVLVSSLSGVSAVAGGYLHALSLNSGGQVYAWGGNSYGQLGTGNTTSSTTPVQVTGVSGVQAIAAGLYHSLALTASGTVYAWGNNANGEVGNGTTTNALSPVQVLNLPSVQSIAAGVAHSLAVTTSGQVYAWGANYAGQLGNGTSGDSSTPVLVSNLASVKAVAGGGAFSLAVTTSGQVYAWGSNYSGQLGNGTTSSGSSTAVQVAGLSNIVAVAAGYDSAYALSASGTLYAWGDDYYGQLGDGSTGGYVLSPEVIAAPTGYHFTSISANNEGSTVAATLAPTAVPGPASLLSCLLGLPGVLALRRRLRNRA